MNFIKKWARHLDSYFQHKMSRKSLVYLTLAFFFMTSLAFGLWLRRLDQTITKSIAEKQLTPTIEFYSYPIEFQKGEHRSNYEILSHFQRLRYRQRNYGQPLLAGDYAEWSNEECRLIIPDLQWEDQGCIAFRRRAPRLSTNTPVSILVLKDGNIEQILSGDPLGTSDSTTLEPELFAQFLGPQAILKRKVEIANTPALCLQAVVAIEDSEFLEHGGVSFKGILRAAYKNILGGKINQGGSTITQQLVKNYFLSNERTFKRKIKELFMAILLEARASKDEILESYINEIYMGQNGAFQVIGYGAASEHYFSKKLEELNLSECALLAALVNAPGIYDPNRHPEKALERRNLVLSRMRELNLITPEQQEAATKMTIPEPKVKILSEPAPYFVDAVTKQLEALDISRDQGLKVFTTLQLAAQEAAQKSVKEGISALEKNNKYIAKLKSEGKTLEGLLISADPFTGFVTAAVGGRSYRVSQFNRLTSGHRQVGSIMKPFVYLAALLKENESGDGYAYNPITIVNDTRFRFTYDRQKWTPENYGNKYFGQVPLFFALQESLNSATARIAVDVGLNNVVDTAMKAGASSELKPLPSLALGAFELYPWEVLQMYATLARLGDYVPLTFIIRVESQEGATLYSHQQRHNQRLEPVPTAVLISMMMQVMNQGTGRAAKLWGFTHPAAGKTGTTSDYRDAWFAGFTPYHVAVSWLGFDDNTPTKLTGASGALPLWIQYMMTVATRYPPNSFTWPEGSKGLTLSREDQIILGVPELDKKSIEPAALIFRDSDDINIGSPTRQLKPLEDEELLPLENE